HGTINTLIGVDGEKVRAFAEAIYGADIDAIGVFTFDAGFGDDVGHFGIYRLVKVGCRMVRFYGNKKTQDWDRSLWN
ncbi:MAG: hypothetical protein RLZZ495_1240, partial [Pseudomonadota bacterium]